MAHVSVSLAFSNGLLAAPWLLATAIAITIREWSFDGRRNAGRFEEGGLRPEPPRDSRSQKAGRNTNLNRCGVALKVLPRNSLADDRVVARFEREMAAVGAVEHANVVRAYDAREIDGTHLLVTELVEGLDLAELVARSGPLPVADACETIRQAALGLQAAHEHGLVHRDRQAIEPDAQPQRASQAAGSGPGSLSAWRVGVRGLMSEQEKEGQNQLLTAEK